MYNIAKNGTRYRSNLLTTRFVSSSVYKREYKAFRNHPGVTPDSPEGGTFWFQSASDNLIAQPPDFSSCPKVRPGDLYYHRAGETAQLWIWVADASSAKYWKEVGLGFMREDRRRLILTDTTKIPSWIGESTFNTKHKRRCKSRDFDVKYHAHSSNLP